MSRSDPRARLPRASLPATALALALVTGCAERVQGSPQAATGTAGPPATTTTVTTPPRSSTEPPRDGGLAALRPCELVDEAALASLGLTGGTEDTVGAAIVCRYRHDGPTLTESFTVSVEQFPTAGLADLLDVVGDGAQRRPKIGSHDAVSFVDGAGVCGVSLGVTETSRVDHTATGGDQRLACQLAERLAVLVEPALP